MLRSIKRNLSGNLSPTRVRFAGTESKTITSTSSTNSRTDGEGSTMEGDTISSASSEDSMASASVPLENPGCTKGGSVDFEGVAVESFRALTLSAWLVSETVFALGAELSRVPRQCGLDSSLDTSRNADFQGEYAGNYDNSLRNHDDSFVDDSSVASFPPQKKRRKRPFGFFGLSNRAKKNFENGLPTSVMTNPSTFPSQSLTSTTKKKVPPKKPASPKVVTPKPEQTRKKRDQSPVRAKKLLTACFVKKPTDEDLILHSRYRTEHEDLQLMGESSVYTIRMSRVPSGEYEDL